MHEELINQLRWAEGNSSETELVQAFPCAINQGVVDEAGNLLPMRANVYVDDILMAAVFRANILRLLAATIEGILFEIYSIGKLLQTHRKNQSIHIFQIGLISVNVFFRGDQHLKPQL